MTTSNKIEIVRVSADRTDKHNSNQTFYIHNYNNTLQMRDVDPFFFFNNLPFFTHK